MAGFFDVALSPAKSVLGGVSDALGLGNGSTIDAAKSSLDDISTRANAVSAQNMAAYQDYLDQMKGMYGEGAQQYTDAVKNLSDAIANRQDFSYTGNVNSFLDPARQQRVAAATDAINNAASAGGSRFSSSYLDRLGAKQQALASEEWSKAYDRMMQDRAAQLQQWQTGQTQQQNKLQNIATLANVYGMDRNALNDAVNSYYTNTINNRNANLQTVADLTAGKAQNELARTNGITDIFGGAATLGAALLK